MNKKKVILISIIIIYMLIFVGTILYFTNKIDTLESIECEEPYVRSTVLLDNKENKIVCYKGILSDENHDVFIEQVIKYDDNRAIKDIKATTVYEFDKEESYLTIKEDLKDCIDTYEEDSKITCDIKEDFSNFMDTWAFKYVRTMNNQGFVCY